MVLGRVPGHIAGRVIKGYECDDVWRGYSRRANMKHTPAADTIYKIFLLVQNISALKFEQSPLSSSGGGSRVKLDIAACDEV